MNGLARPLLGSAVLWIVFCCPGRSEDDSAARLGQSLGMVAVQADESSPWSVLRPLSEDPLPERCRLRTAAFGEASTLVHLGEASLHIAEDTRLDLDSKARRAAVENGCVFLSASGQEKSAWTLHAGDFACRLEKGSAAEMRVAASGLVQLAVTQGSAGVTIGAPAGKPRQIAAGKEASWSPTGAKLETEALSGEQRQRIEAWTSTVPQSQGLGQLLVGDAQSESPVRLNVARYHVNVVLQPPVALVQIDQSFYNPYSQQEEGTFVFNLPRGASVSRFAMYVTPGELIEGELIERKRASQVYETIVRQRRDPAILEQIGDNLFRMRVFPIFARDTKRILLDYTVPLDSDGGECRFRLPLLSDLEPIWDFRMSGTILGPTRLDSVASETHAGVQFTDETGANGAIRFDFRQHDYKPETDFALRFTQEQAPSREATVRSYVAQPLPPSRHRRGRATDRSFRNLPESYFLATFEPPPEEESSHSAPPPADVLILADTSSGMRERDALEGAVRTVLGNLRPADRFHLACVDVEARPLHEGWLAPEAEKIRSVLDRFDEQFFLGETNLVAGLHAALEAFKGRSADRRRLVVYVGDGDDTVHSADAAQVGDLLSQELEPNDASLAGVIVQPSVHGWAVLDAAARASGGLLFDLADSGADNRDLFAWLLAGMPTARRIERVDVAGADPDDVFFPTAWLPGHTLQVYGRTTADSVRTRVTLGGSEEPQALSAHAPIIDDTLAMPRQPGADLFLGRLWAQRKLEDLRRAESQAPDSGQATVRDEIVSLSREWSLLSPYTAFLVLESENDYARWDIDRQQRRRYWRPADATPREPLPADWLARVGVEARSRDRRLPWKADDLAAVLRDARAALAAGDAGRAFSILERASDRELAQQSDEYARLRSQALASVQLQAAIEQLGPARAVFDPSAEIPWFSLRARAAPLLTAPLTVSSQFLGRHPYAEHLLKEVEMNSPLKATETFNVADLAAMLSDAGPLNVVVDIRALEDVGLSYDEKAPIFGLGRMSLRNYARFLLRQLDLVLVEEPHRLLITTPEEAEARLDTEVYPVADLLHLDRVADDPLLAHPYLDHNERSRREIESQLKRPVTIDFQDFPLDLAVAHFAEVVDSTMLVDLRALDDWGINFRATRVTASWKDVPAKDSLRWILDSLDLDYTIRGGAVIITTPEEIEMELSVRLHSGRGLVYGETMTAEEWTQMQQAQRGGMGRGFAGFGGGMGGGMGIGGGMGGGMGMGGGAGGLGGGMGGFGGAVPWDTSNAGLSAVGDVGAEAAEQEPDNADLPPTAPPPAPPASSPPSIVVYDTDSIVEQITTTIQPETWEDVGGAGSIVFFEPTLDLVLAQTDSGHDEVEALFNRLRALPTEVAEEGGLGALDKPAAGPGRDPRAYLEDLIDMLTTAVDPENWDDVGGACSLGADRSRLALIVSATDDTHDGVAQLLTMLRRSRWEALRSTRPWETGTVWSTTTGRESPTLAALPTGLRLSDLAEPEPGELEALSVRRGPEPGAQAWRRAASGGAPPTTFVLRQSDDGTEIQMPDGTLRIDAEAAAVACPSLGVVELGDWGEAARRMLDVWLPWMPHRTNEELARLYSVQAISSDDEKKGATNAVRLRLIPQGLPESAKTYLEIDYSTKTGLVAGWQSFRGGELVGRMSFGKAAPPSGLPAVTWKNASGGTRMVWELLETKPLDEKLAELTAGWDGFLLLDRRSEEPSVDPPFRAALDAVSQRQWSQAAAQADAALKQHSSHPLLLLLKAWCYENDPRLGSQPQQLKLLEEVARSRATSLAHFVADGNFSWLSSEQLYRLLTLVPPDARTAANCDDLARAAVATGELEIALEHTDAAEALGGPSDVRFVRRKRRIELLLKLGRAESAAEAARQWAQNAQASPERLADLAEMLASHGQAQLAGEMFDRAVGGRGLSVDARYALLRRRAGTLSQEGLPRWRTLLSAALVYPADSPVRQQTMSTLLAELHLPAHAEVAGVLAKETDDPAASVQLVLREAELTLNPGQAADICSRLLALGRLPQERRTWALGVWNKAGRPQDTIKAAEDWLRTDPAHTDTLLRYELAAAYGAVGRPRDARRAGSTDAARRIRSTQWESGGLF